MEPRIVSLLAQPITLRRSGGRQYGAEPGSEFVTVPPSGVVAVVKPTTALIPIAEHVAVQGNDASGAPLDGVFVDIHHVSGPAWITGIPTAPGHYIVSAQVADSIDADGRKSLLAHGVRLYTPGLLVFPGHAEHPGKGVLPGPFAPYLIRRV